MSESDRSWVANFISGMAADVLRDVHVPGKYGDVILPMVIIQGLHVLLEPTKDAVLKKEIAIARGKDCRAARCTLPSCRPGVQTVSL